MSTKSQSSKATSRSRQDDIENRALWVRGHALKRDPILNAIGITSPSEILAVPKVGPMAVLHQMFALHEKDFCLVYKQYPPSTIPAETLLVLVRDEEIGKEAAELMESRKLPILPFDINEIMDPGFIEEDIKIWRSVF
ncbi:hypothetical protein APHAL10511_008548 [Amanita phalloides]|nr:hypothetical protein APHAL10511_008548 [Amanita phalloides]